MYCGSTVKAVQAVLLSETLTRTRTASNLWPLHTHNTQVLTSYTFDAIQSTMCASGEAPRALQAKPVFTPLEPNTVLSVEATAAGGCLLEVNFLDKSSIVPLVLATGALVLGRGAGVTIQSTGSACCCVMRCEGAAYCC